MLCKVKKHIVVQQSLCLAELVLPALIREGLTKIKIKIRDRSKASEKAKGLHKRRKDREGSKFQALHLGLLSSSEASTKASTRQVASFSFFSLENKAGIHRRKGVSKFLQFPASSICNGFLQSTSVLPLLGEATRQFSHLKN